jgi:hypothetical protein
MLSEERLQKIKKLVSNASPAPWTLCYSYGELVPDNPDSKKSRNDTVPKSTHHIQLKSDGKHRFWFELTDTHFLGDVVADFDFITESRQLVPELIAEIERLRSLLGDKAAKKAGS